MSLVNLINTTLNDVTIVSTTGQSYFIASHTDIAVDQSVLFTITIPNGIAISQQNAGMSLYYGAGSLGSGTSGGNNSNGGGNNQNTTQNLIYVENTFGVLQYTVPAAI